jgi:hypothetical protein
MENVFSRRPLEQPVLNLFKFLPSVSPELRYESIKQTEYFPHIVTATQVLPAQSSMTNIPKGSK